MAEGSTNPQKRPEADTRRIRAFLAIPVDPVWAESAQGLIRAVAPASPLAEVSFASGGVAA